MNNQSNLSANPVFEVSNFQPIYHTFLLILAILIAIENATVILLYFKNTFLHSGAANRLSANLAMSDIMTGIVTIPLTIASASLAGRNNVNMMTLYFISNVASDFCTIYSVISICLMAYNRYMLVCRPYGSAANNQRFPGRKHLILAFCFSFIISILPLSWNYSLLIDESEPVQSYQEIGDRVHSLTTTFLFFFLPSCLVLASLLLMFREVRKSLQEETRNSLGNKGFRKTQFAAFLRFLYVYVAFLLCWLPLMVIRTLDDFNTDIARSMNVHVLEMLFALRCFTSFFNPIAYTWCNPDYKRALFNWHCYKVIKNCICREPNGTLTDNSTSQRQDIPLSAI